MCCMLSIVHLPLTCQQCPAMFVFAKCHPQCAQQLFGQQALEENTVKLSEHSLHPPFFLSSVTTITYDNLQNQELVDHCTVTVDGYFVTSLLMAFHSCHDRVSQSLEFLCFCAQLLAAGIQGYGNASFIFANFVALIDIFSFNTTFNCISVSRFSGIVFKKKKNTYNHKHSVVSSLGSSN